MFIKVVWQIKFLILFISVALAFLVVPSFSFAQTLISLETEDEAVEGSGPVVRSVEFPDADSWYPLSGGTFTWDLPEETTAVAIELATSSEAEPMESYRPPVSEFVVSADDLSEGVQHLLVQFKDAEEWGEVTAVPIKIDDTAPQPFSIDIAESESDANFAEMTFKTEDSLSGIAYYQVYIGDRPAVTVSADEARNGYQLRNRNQSYYVHVVAYDQAGNGTASSLLILGGTGSGAEWLLLGQFEPEALLIALLSTIVLILFGYLFAERRRYAREEERLMIETEEIEIQMTKIFTALRDEIYDQIRAITKKKKLSKGEKEAVDGLNKALEVSEHLIEKEIKDVERMLK